MEYSEIAPDVNGNDDNNNLSLSQGDGFSK